MLPPEPDLEPSPGQGCLPQAGRAAPEASLAAPEAPPHHPPGEGIERIERMMLCLFTDSMDPSGLGEHMLELARELEGAWRVVFACPSGPKGDPFLERARSLGLQVLALPPAEEGPPEIGWLRGWLRENGCSVFHAHAGIGWEGHEAVRAAHAAGCAVVRTEHLPYLLTDEAQVQDHSSLLGCVHRLICVSQRARDTFAQHGIDGSLLRAVRNGIAPKIAADAAVADAPSRARAALLSELGLPPSARLLLTVGRFTRQKGHEFLLRALPLLDSALLGELLGELPEELAESRARLLWVGEGRDWAELEAQARALGLGERVHFLGRRSDVPALLLASDAVVLPSLFEGLPLAALEAMSAGVPIVGTRVCGTEEALGSESCGWLVPPCDPGALALALAHLLSRPGEAARRAERARQRFRAEFTAERMARETQAIYHEALLEQAQQAQAASSST